MAMTQNLLMRKAVMCADDDLPAPPPDLPFPDAYRIPRAPPASGFSSRQNSQVQDPAADSLQSALQRQLSNSLQSSVPRQRTVQPQLSSQMSDGGRPIADCVIDSPAVNINRWSEIKTQKSVNVANSNTVQRYPEKVELVAREQLRKAAADSEAKEEEVDKLTHLLVKRITSMPLPPNAHGYCGRCEQPVFYTDSGCSAMNQVFHVDCFKCNKCNAQLRGGSFYSVDGKALCEQDYLETLEKCVVCRKPITDRILRATGKPFHADCFRCIVCNKCLDGVPFTVDANNQVHCIDDFHRHFREMLAESHKIANDPNRVYVSPLTDAIHRVAANVKNL